MRLFRKFATACSLGTFATLMAVGPAQALTLGDTAVPAGSKSVVCTSNGTAEIVQMSTDASYQYTVPASGGTINSWSFNTTGATAGTPYELMIGRPTGANNYQVVATDAETVPANAPTIATFTLAQPIAVQAGDVLGIVSSGSGSTAPCLFRAGALNGSDMIGNGNVNNGVGNPPNGSSFPIERSTPNELVNVSANLVQSNDVALAQVAEPPSVIAGGDDAFVLSVADSGPSRTPVTLTDTVPAGLSILSVSAGSAPCTVSGQNISCALSGAPASVAIVVSAPTAGTFTNSAQAKGTVNDPNQANNTASATLTVTPSLGQSIASAARGLSAAGTTEWA